MSGRYIRNPKKVALGLSVLLLALTVLIGLFAAKAIKDKPSNPKPTPSSQADVAVNGGGNTATNDDDESAQNPNNAEEHSPKTFPEEMRAVTFVPGKDYLTGESQEETNKRIDTMIASAKQMTMNTVIIATDMQGKVIFPSTVLPMAEISYDPIPYIISKCKEEGMYSYITLPAVRVIGSGTPSSTGRVDVSKIDNLSNDIEAFCERYQPNGVIIDGYYNVASDKSYSDYLMNGGSIGYENYMYQLSEVIFSTVSNTLRANAPWLHVGMMTEPVWANKSYNEEGSSTASSFTTMYTGYTNSKQLLEENLSDFVALKATGSIDDTKIPYKSVVKWWSDIAKEQDVPLYVVHSSDKAATDAVGWSQYDQLTRQVIEARTMKEFSGSIFNSFGRLEEDPIESATMLVKYYNNQVKPEHVLTDLAVTKPAKKVYTTFEPTVTFSGASDPNTSVTINKEEVKTDTNGYFTLTLPLEAGLNTFDFYHKGKTDKYSITRQVKVVKDVTPSGNIALDGGMRLSISVLAYNEAKVTATLNGKTIQLTPSEADSDATNKDSNYGVFTGSFTVPDSTTSVQDLGKIVVTGQWSGFKDSADGAFVKINKRMPVVDGKPVVVVVDQAQTFSASSIDVYGDPSMYPLARGTIDYTNGNEIVYTVGNKSYSFYKLASGVRIGKDDIASVNESQAVGNNRITGMTVTADNRYTNVIINTKQTVSYKVGYDGSKVTIQFNYTDFAPSSIKLNQNPLFSAANWSGATLTLPLLKQGCFMGYYAYFDSSGNLVFRFNNPPASINGAKIVLDPGHGGADTGALGFLAAYPEKVINNQIATKLTEELRNRGATVVQLDTFYNNPTVPQRTAMGQAQNPHIFISVHSNSTTYAGPTGSEAYHFYPFSASLSKYIAANMASALSTNNRGGKFAYFYVTRTAQYPSVLLETGFVSTQAEYAKLLDANYQYGIANGVANAVESYIKGMNTGYLGLTGTQSTGNTATDTKDPVQTPPENETPAGSTATKIVLSEESAISLGVEDSISITAELSPDDAEGEIIWTYVMSHEDAAVVSADGDTVFVEALNPGTITVTATMKGSTSVKASCKITIE